MATRSSFPPSQSEMIRNDDKKMHKKRLPSLSLSLSLECNPNPNPTRSDGSTIIFGGIPSTVSSPVFVSVPCDVEATHAYVPGREFESLNHLVIISINCTSYLFNKDALCFYVICNEKEVGQRVCKLVLHAHHKRVISYLSHSHTLHADRHSARGLNY